MICLTWCVIHSPQKDVFQRIAPLMHALDLYTLACSNGIKVAGAEMVRHDQFDSATGKSGKFETKVPDLGGECLYSAHGFQFNEVAMQAALLFEVAKRGNAAIVKDQNL